MLSDGNLGYSWLLRSWGRIGGVVSSDLGPIVSSEDIRFFPTFSEPNTMSVHDGVFESTIFS